MDLDKKILDDILLIHSIGCTTSAGLSVCWEDGKRHIIKGVRSSIVDLDIPAVILLYPESTPQNRLTSISAHDELSFAIRNLIEKNQKFYTELRPDWTLPAFLWILA